MGAWVSSRLVDVSAADLAAFLMPPGVLAVAFALNFRQILPAPAGDTLLSTVAIGTAAFELFALAVVPHWRRGVALVRRLIALVITMGLAWLVVAQVRHRKRQLGRARARRRARRRVDRRMALRVRPAAADHRLPRVRPDLRTLARQHHHRPDGARPQAVSGFAVVVIAVIAGLHINLERTEAAGSR